MPKFYRQNKKRIDPRYFLNETTNIDQNPELARQIYYRLQGLENKPGFEKGTPARKALQALEIRASKSVDAQDGSLNDEEYRQLVALISDSSLRLNPSDPNSFAGKVLAMLSGAPGDTDGDGTSDSEELMQIAQSMKNKNHGLTSSVMQDDDNIPLSKKIPSGYS